MRVLVLRPADQAARTAEALVALGHEPIVCPILTITSLDTVPPTGPFHALLVTSANAAPALARHRAELPERVFAVGSETGREVAAAGFSDVTPADGDAETLAALVASRSERGDRLLYAGGRHRRPEPERSLREAGFAVLVWETYDAVAATCFPLKAAAAVRAHDVDAVLHFSPRSAALATQLASEAGLASEWTGMIHACLSQNVAAPLPAGLPRIRVASARNEHALLALLGADGAAEQTGGRGHRGSGAR